MEAPAQSGSGKDPLSPPTPTSAFNTAELVAEAQKQALSGDGSSGFSQPITMPNAFPGGVPGLKPRAPQGIAPLGLPPSHAGAMPPALPTHAASAHAPSHAPLPPPRYSPSPQPFPAHSPVPVPPGMGPGLAPGMLPGLAPVSGAYPSTQSGQSAAVALRAELPRDVRASTAHVVRTRAYAFVLDGRSFPIEIGSGRFAKAYLGEERWLESKTDYRRPVVIKILQKGVSDEDRMRFQIEKELLERVQGHPNIVGLHCSGEADDPEFVPPVIRDKVENDFVILERLDMSLEERLKGARARNKREDLLSYDLRERLFRVLDYTIPVASAIEYAHLVKNVCHRDIKPANVLIGLPDTTLRGSTLEVRLADFNVAKLHDEDVNFQMTQLKSVPGTLFFQSPEQETNVLELLVNVVQGSPEVEFFEDFYIQIAKNDTFSLFNRNDEYEVLYADRTKKRIVLDKPYREPSEVNVRAKIRKSVGRPADIYSLGATFYYLISGAYANPKTLYDAFHKFIEYENPDETNTIDGYLAHEYGIIDSLRAPKPAQGAAAVAPADRFFTYKHYLDGNGDLIEPHVMKIIAKCMIRNKPDSYCQAHDVETRGISTLVQDLIELYAVYGFHPAAGSTQMARRGHQVLAKSGFRRGLDRFGLRMKRMWNGFLRMFGKRP
jgi:serine/threonine protein kinase